MRAAETVVDDLEIPDDAEVEDGGIKEAAIGSRGLTLVKVADATDNLARTRSSGYVTVTDTIPAIAPAPSRVGILSSKPW
jgi:hypothetical protein